MIQFRLITHSEKNNKKVFSVFKFLAHCFWMFRDNKSVLPGIRVF